MKIKVVVVEDDPEIRDRMSLILHQSNSCTPLAAFESAEEAIKEIPSLNPDVVLMDIFLTGMTGIDAIRLLKPQLPLIQFLVCTVMQDNENIFNALKAGATGYVLKSTPDSGILSAIEELYQGGSPMSLEIARKVIGSFQTAPLTTHGLSKREGEVIELLSQGYRYKKIADKLSISIDTVNSHVRSIYDKLQVNSKVEAVMKFKKGQ